MPESTKIPAEVLVKARDAAMTVCVGFDEEGEDVFVGPNTAEEIASAVLAAIGALDLIEAIDQLDKWIDRALSANAIAPYARASALIIQRQARTALRQASIHGGEA